VHFAGFEFECDALEDFLAVNGRVEITVSKSVLL
jgi:hypothetical protein